MKQYRWTIPFLGLYFAGLFAGMNRGMLGIAAGIGAGICAALLNNHIERLVRR